MTETSDIQMRTRFCELAQINYPVVLAPMAGAVGPQLVASVSNAGGLGLAPLWHVDVRALKQSVREIKDLTDRPFGVNLNMEFPSEMHLDACLEEGVPIISLFWKNPEDFVARARAGGAKVIYTASSVADARDALELGVDAICAQGWEAGGHVRSMVSTMALVPAIADVAGDIPVIAAGGIGDGRGLAAAMALGASAAWIGTRFLAAEEASIHPDYLSRLIAASENDTEHFDNLFDINWPDAPHRVLKNSTTRSWHAAGCPPPGQRPGEGDLLATSGENGQVLRYQSSTPGPNLEGDIEATSMWAGQGVSLVREVRPAKDIVDEIVSGALDIFDAMPGRRQ